MYKIAIWLCIKPAGKWLRARCRPVFSWFWKWLQAARRPWPGNPPGIFSGEIGRARKSWISGNPPPKSRQGKIPELGKVGWIIWHKLRYLISLGTIPERPPRSSCLSKKLCFFLFLGHYRGGCYGGLRGCIVRYAPKGEGARIYVMYKDYT